MTKKLTVFALAASLLISAVAHAATLDNVSASASAAYSLRKILDSYAGPAIRVRRSSDNAQADIGFNAAGNLDQSALKAFVGNGDGFVVTWYDQSGNALHATDATVSDQPQIVSSGSVLKSAQGLPAVRFNGGNTLSVPSGQLVEKNDVFAVGQFSAQPDTTPGQLDVRLWNLAAGNSTRLSAGGNDGEFGVAYGAGFLDQQSGTDIQLNEVFLATLVADGTLADGSDQVELFLNGDSILSLANANIDEDDNTLVIGSQNNVGDRGLDGFLQELIFFSDANNLSASDFNTLNSDLIASLVAVPEPESVLVVMLVGAIGLVGFVLFRRKISYSQHASNQSRSHFDANQRG